MLLSLSNFRVNGADNGLSLDLEKGGQKISIQSIIPHKVSSESQFSVELKIYDDDIANADPSKLWVFQSFCRSEKFHNKTYCFQPYIKEGENLDFGSISITVPESYISLDDLDLGTICMFNLIGFTGLNTLQSSWELPKGGCGE